MSVAGFVVRVLLVLLYGCFWCCCVSVAGVVVCVCVLLVLLYEYCWHCCMCCMSVVVVRLSVTGVFTRV